MDSDDDLFDVFNTNSAQKRKKPLDSNENDIISNEEKNVKMAKIDNNNNNNNMNEDDNANDNQENVYKFDKVPQASDDFAKYVEQKVETIKTLEAHGCMAQRCFPPNFDLDEFQQSEKEISKQPKNVPAKEYPFILDPFQSEAIEFIERNQSVLVSAHTSAGKTVVAEYAIALSLKRGQRVIYTSPIKALSNQKYRELHEEFEDVGLMTGDTTINPSASCLVMTTEILRNMLYRGSEVMREVAWVIFDEIHYMRDRARGVVWEETLILLPDKVRYVFLSATIPNATEFASWIAKLHNQPCNVVYTDYRPTPLQHYMYPQNADGLYLVVDDKGEFREDNFQRALACITEEQDDDNQNRNKRNRRRRKKRSTGTDVFKIVKMIMERKYDPVIVFSFSKRDCESHALAMSKLDFTDENEKKLIHQIFVNAMESLAEDDRHLPQVENILPLLKRGIGIHHGGLLPILKELIEILFQEGLIKCLFSTETFSMGLNMPAKTVVFTSFQKYDGTGLRPVTSGEYIQMSGRAGRRGLDDRGIVILMLESKMEPEVAKEMVKGEADPLKSSFYLSYNMLLNLMRVEDADPEYMIVRSFFQFQASRAAPKYQEELKLLKEQYNTIQIDDVEKIAKFYHLKHQVNKYNEKIRNKINEPIYLLPFLTPGRLARVRHNKINWGWGIILGFKKLRNKKRSKNNNDINLDDSDATYIVDVLLKVKPLPSGRARTKHDPPEPCPPGMDADYEIIPVLSTLLDGLSSVCLYTPKDVTHRSAKVALGKSLREVEKRFPDGAPLLDPIEDMKCDDENFKKLLKKLENAEKRLASHESVETDEAKLNQQYEEYGKYMELKKKIDQMEEKVKNAIKDLTLLQTLKQMKRVLRRLDCASADNVIQTKGRVAAEISTSDELLATELIFAGVFNDLTAEQTASLASVFVFDERVDEKTKLPEELAIPFRRLKELARRIAQVKHDAKLPIDIDEYVDSLNANMMPVVYEWCKGAKFVDICKMTDVFEGSIIRIMRRLEELLRQLASAAKAIGNTELENKFNSAIEKLKRDIVFAASLYL